MSCGQEAGKEGRVSYQTVSGVPTAAEALRCRGRSRDSVSAVAHPLRYTSLFRDPGDRTDTPVVFSSAAADRLTSGTVEAVLRLRLVCVGVLHQRWHPLGASAPHRLRLTLACSVTPVCSVTAGSYNTG